MAPTICLNMIVKNEAHVICRCLASVKPFIDYWVIVDTGSSDGTQELIQDTLKDLPGELYERPWKDFGHNRTEALRLAQGRADYLFIIDADEVVVTPSGFQMPALSADGYLLLHSDASISYWRLGMVASSLNWYYVGVLHEYLTCDMDYHSELLPGLKVVGYYDGGRNTDPIQKYVNDARILEQALQDEPDNTRYIFYLAQSYRDSTQLEKSLHTYQRRVDMGGWAEEVWYALYEIAMLSERLGFEAATVVDRYLQAYQFRPQRAEPLGQLARFYRQRNQYALSHLFAARAIAIPKPTDSLFLDNSYYDWLNSDEYAIASYWIGDYQESACACHQLLNSTLLPAAERARVIDNLNFALRALR